MNNTTSKRSRWLMRAAFTCLLTISGAAAAWGQPPPGASRGGPGPTVPLEATVQGYPIVGVDVAGVAERLKEMYPGRADVQIAPDPRLRQVVVVAPPEVQREIARLLSELKLSAPGPAGGAAPPPQGQPAPPPPLQQAGQPQAMVTQSWQLRNLNWKDFENRLLKTWGSRVEASQDPVGDVSAFRFPPTPAGQTSIVVDRRTSLVTIATPQSSAASWQRLMTILDSRPTTTNERTSLVPLSKADPKTVQRAITLVQQVAAAADPHRKQHIGQFVSMIFQPEAGAAQPPFAAQPPPAPAPPEGAQPETVQVAEAPPGSTAEAIARITNVQIEILDDVVIIRGREQDVQRVMQIIEQIEQQSLEFKPEVEVYYLKHVDGQAINNLITQVYAAAFARQGPVTIVPLVKPNALLLIGRKENIPPVIELIVKLDQPVAPDTEFHVFHLKHMSAIDAERTIRNFFVDLPGRTTNPRGGLGPFPLVIAEFRANTLIVHASPRDMLEITRLIEALDVESSLVTNEIRIFKLRNALAEELAPTLQEAITGTGAAITAQTQQQAVGGAAGATSPARATPPALSLQFLRIDAGGQQLLQSGILSNMRISADTRGNSLIVVGPASAMELMGALIGQLDRLPASEAQVKVFTITNGDATTLADMLSTLFGQPTAAQAGAFAQTATGQGESTLVPIRFSVDTRTNSIIATGTAGDLNVIYAILTRLDEADIRTRITSVVRLKNVYALDVANALTTMLNSQRTLNAFAPQLVTAYQQAERDFIVVPEIVTNSLIISATPKYYPEIQKVVEALDRRPPMIAIQVVIAEVTLDDRDQFGVEWGLQDALMFDRSSSAAGNRFNFNGATLTLPNDPGATSLATATNVATQALSNLTVGRQDSALGFGGLVLTASSESVNVLLRALEFSSRAQIISRPQVQTLDNIAAYVQVGARVPRIVGATTTTFGVTPIVNDVNVGIIMQVTPRTSPDGTIVMQIYAEKSSVGPQATGIPVAFDATGQPIISPQIPITTAQTTVSARSGQTVILGGLITRDQEETTRRIPYLADIPVLGRLFRFDTVTTQRTELLIIMTPYILKTDEEIEMQNIRESERMSWCIADLVNIHGPVPLAGNSAFNRQEAPLIFPDMTPSAVAPATPTPAPGPAPEAPLPGLQLAPPGPPAPPTPGPQLPPPPSGYVPPSSVIVPQPPSLMAPQAFGEPGTLVPQTIQPAAPPVGTQARVRPFPPPLLPPAVPPGMAPQIPFGPPPGQGPPMVAPAGYQQPAWR